ncbi:MAG: hypothetical protein M1594_02270 [Candidatus Marsarchaeota archaeon]|nr:hypothetical protein [Candidatus Marsarchaeota archaeon]
MIISQWFKVISNPKEVFRQEKNNASLKKTFASLLVAMILLLLYLMASLYSNTLFKPPQQTNISQGIGYDLAEALGNTVMLIIFFLLFIIIPLIIYPIMFLLAGGLFYIFGLIIYKKSNGIKTQYYLFSLFQPGLILLSIIFGFVFSLLSISAAWVVLIAFIYSLYLDFKATQTNFNT